MQTLADVATALGIKPGTLSEWKKRGCKALKKRPFDLEAIKQWRQENIGAQTRVRSQATLDLIERSRLADTIWKEAKARLADYEMATDSGKLIYADDSQRMLDDQAKLFRAELTNMPQVWADRLVGKERDEVVAVLTDIVTDILGRLSKGEE